MGQLNAIILMGVCCSFQQQWDDSYKPVRRPRRRKTKRQKTSSIIQQEKTVYESSFASMAQDSFRDDLHQTISSLANENWSIFMGSVLELKQGELQALHKSLQKFKPEAELHQLHEDLILCNLKTKNYLHTHKVRHPQSKALNEVSCCPYKSSHIPDYDVWKFIRVQEPLETDCQTHPPEYGEQSIHAYIYHPFTQRFLGYEKGVVVGCETKTVWKVQSFGPRRNGGFLKISLPGEQGQLCMSEQKGLLEKHRKLQICNQKHISHLWQLMFVSPELI